MPELPEVETVLRGLEPVMAGQRIDAVHVRRFDLRKPIPPDFESVLRGRQIVSLQRRGKYIVALLDDGRGFVLHLGMSGQILITSAVDNYKLRTHDHVIFTMQNRARIVLNDARRFGMLFLVDAKTWMTHDAFKNMGPEPCGNGFNGPVLADLLKGRRTPIKTALLDQNVVAGVGNIYACEALHMAEISPLRIAAEVQGAEAEALAESIRKVLLKAIDAGGSTLKDYHHTDGTLGYFQHQLLVYDRADEPCPRCACRKASGGVIKKSSKKPPQQAVLVKRIIQSGRSSFYCSNCQT